MCSFIMEVSGSTNPETITLTSYLAGILTVVAVSYIVSTFNKYIRVGW